MGILDCLEFAVYPGICYLLDEVAQSGRKLFFVSNPGPSEPGGGAGGFQPPPNILQLFAL